MPEEVVLLMILLVLLSCSITFSPKKICWKKNPMGDALIITTICKVYVVLENLAGSNIYH